MNERVSVIIPTFNRQHTLLRAINSALQQTYPVYEILICDDGSDDNSKDIISELNNPRIKWLDCGKNGWPSIPRNKGIKAAIGEWIAFLDSDDEWLPNKIEIQINLLKETNSQAVSCNAFRIVEEKNKGPYLSYKGKSIAFKDFLSANNNICSSVLLSKNLLEKAFLFPEEKEYMAMEDYVLWLRISTKTNFSYIKEPLLKYYDNPKSPIRNLYTYFWQIRKVAFAGFSEWMDKNKIILHPLDEEKFDFMYNEIFTNRKSSKLQQMFRRLKAF
ncbi:MAG: glycosyltransferase family 2 protein [Ferruginibacter sp.]|nr:glycosyltransferase family 2 protein [Ferruginibacter sp.]